jgi:murein L,D-transpeptidase YafK
MISSAQQTLPTSPLLETVRKRTLPTISALAKAKGCAVGQPVFMRTFKESNELEVWLKPSAKAGWKLIKTYPIATWGEGKLGPKLAEGDKQAPEGFYKVHPHQMNPFSSYHLSFNLGFPNAYDQALKRTGSALMIHGANVSIGCFAMNDSQIEEIYLFADRALAKGQASFEVHCFPFRFTPERMQQAAQDPNLAFWKNLQQGYDWFERKKQLPKVSATAAGYQFK